MKEIIMSTFEYYKEIEHFFPYNKVEIINSDMIKVYFSTGEYISEFIFTPQHLRHLRDFKSRTHMYGLIKQNCSKQLECEVVSQYIKENRIVNVPDTTSGYSSYVISPLLKKEEVMMHPEQWANELCCWKKRR